MKAPTPHGVAVDKLLSDGDWHSFDEIIGVVAATLPSGVAFRKAESRRLGELRRARSKGVPEGTYSRRGPVDSSVAVGHRMVARELVSSRVVRGRWDRNGDYYRTNQEQHDRP